jgi:hypothetical protein
MGIAIYYTSTRTLTPAEADRVRAAAAAAAITGHSWLSSEPVHFFPGLQDGKLVGGSKPNFTPHPGDSQKKGDSHPFCKRWRFFDL